MPKYDRKVAEEWAAKMRKEGVEPNMKTFLEFFNGNIDSAIYMLSYFRDNVNQTVNLTEAAVENFMESHLTDIGVKELEDGLNPAKVEQNKEIRAIDWLHNLSYPTIIQSDTESAAVGLQAILAALQAFKIWTGLMDVTLGKQISESQDNMILEFPTTEGRLQNYPSIGPITVHTSIDPDMELSEALKHSLTGEGMGVDSDVFDEPVDVDSNWDAEDKGHWGDDWS